LVSDPPFFASSREADLGFFMAVEDFDSLVLKSFVFFFLLLLMDSFSTICFLILQFRLGLQGDKVLDCTAPGKEDLRFFRLAGFEEVAFALAEHVLVFLAGLLEPDSFLFRLIFIVFS